MWSREASPGAHSFLMACFVPDQGQEGYRVSNLHDTEGRRGGEVRGNLSIRIKVTDSR